MKILKLIFPNSACLYLESFSQQLTYWKNELLNIFAFIIFLYIMLPQISWFQELTIFFIKAVKEWPLLPKNLYSVKTCREIAVLRSVKLIMSTKLQFYQNIFLKINFILLNFITIAIVNWKVFSKEPLPQYPFSFEQPSKWQF